VGAADVGSQVVKRAEGLLDEVDRALAESDGEVEETEEEVAEEKPVEVSSRAEIVREQFAAAARESYLAGAGLATDARQASVTQLRGLVDLWA
jgi:predicted ribosome quality control (RQC) complex YloA/Tae2 family protein